ncbi:MAG: CinA family nicotinamide mononucleotide deamidase-related protein [Elusimicrobia bacterium]|nr:CinA family nicotinamide mononucleotide deamidase-related protein [Elusimicrobiota bacterium]
MTAPRPPAPAAPRVELLCVGSELLAGQVNTHVGAIGRRLLAAGLRLSRESTLPDDEAALGLAIKGALARCDALIVCGGLGPTFDDVTREAAASALGLRLVYRPRIFDRIRARFARLRLRTAAENKRQAFVLAGARVLANKTGTAPGQLLSIPPQPPGSPSALRRTLVLLPGPYHELSPMFEGQVLPFLKKTYARSTRTEELLLHLTGIPESLADEKLRRLVGQARPGLSFTILSSPGQVDFHAYVSAPTAARAAASLRKVRAAALAAVGAHVLWEGERPVEKVLADELGRRRLTLAVAESCTGGMVGAALTNVPGSSAFFRGSVTPYANDLKASLLGVSPATIARHGSVSVPCCREMAEGVRRLAGASVGLAVTGIAGPAGGTPAKPVGTVFVGIAGPGSRFKAHKLRLGGGRSGVRGRATVRALQLVLQAL